MLEPPDRARGLLRWVEARNHAIDLVEEVGLTADGEWPPFWAASIPLSPAEHDALRRLAATRERPHRRAGDRPGSIPQDQPDR